MVGAALQRLFQYFNGANKDEKKFNLTTPVVTAFRPENNFTTASHNFTVSFYLPEKFQVGSTSYCICILVGHSPDIVVWHQLQSCGTLNKKCGLRIRLVKGIGSPA